MTRPPPPGPQARAYRNRTRGVWSVKVGRAPVRHEPSVLLTGVTFVVWAGGRSRVLRTRRRTVHAFAAGAVAGPCPPPAALARRGFVRAGYDPFRGPTFCLLGAGEPVRAAAAAGLDAAGRLWVLRPTTG